MRRNEASHCEYDGKLMETETTKWPEVPKWKKGIAEQIPTPEEINKSTRAGRENHSVGSD